MSEAQNRALAGVGRPMNELVCRENGVSLEGKWATQLSTSKHFYDTTAHAFIRENCADLALRYIPGLS
ncbi:MAG: hypothetical protein II001_03425, partial [Bacteroidales bacterium]|nr:hypothetical protein [Bacteroidales bacterium]